VRILDTQIQFVVNIDNNIPNALLGDEVRIRQIFLNILNNAVKYSTGKGIVSLSISGTILENDTINLTASITDNGKGIKREDIDRLFGDFVQVDMENNYGIEGTGLGLAISRSLVEAMGGNITVSSEYGVGSTFTIVLPQKIREYGKLAVVENPEEKSVLVYEKSQIYADSVIRTIKDLGVQCTLVSNDFDFHEEISSGKYFFVFVASTLYASVQTVCSMFNEITVVLLAEFNESVPDQNLNVLAMPVYPTSVANILLGIIDGYSYGEIASIARFTAPEASVLVVDDLLTNLNVTKGLLSPYEMRVTLCRSGKEAIEAISVERYDLVFMDHMMPGMDGIQAVARIRALNTRDPYYTSVPIIALTANAVVGTKEMFLEKGFDDFLSKPMDVIKLNSLLEQWIPAEKQNKSMITIGTGSGLLKQGKSLSLTIEGVDVKKGLIRSGENVENYKHILNIFYHDGVEKAKQIAMCLEANDLASYVIHVHALKSAAASIGADPLSEFAKALETAGKREDQAFLQTHTPTLLSDLGSLLNAIGTALKAEEKAGQTKATDMALLKSELIKLTEAIDKVDPHAIKEAFKNIQPFTQDAEVGDVVKNILQSTLIGEYDEAVSLIETLLH
jgi:CheY-like chemotaxis protein